MKLYAECKNCKEPFLIKSSVNSRHELEDEKGRYFITKCSNCSASEEYHVNDVTAESGNDAIIFYVVFGIALFIILIILFLSLGYFSFLALGIPLFVYINLKGSKKKSIELFNSHGISKLR